MFVFKNMHFGFFFSYIYVIFIVCMCMFCINKGLINRMDNYFFSNNEIFLLVYTLTYPIPGHLIHPKYSVKYCKVHCRCPHIIPRNHRLSDSWNHWDVDWGSRNSGWNKKSINLPLVTMHSQSYCNYSRRCTNSRLKTSAF